MRSLLAAAGAVVIGAAWLSVPAAAAEGCILASGTQQVHPSYNVGGQKCSYNAAKPGSYEGVGTYTVQVYASPKSKTPKCTDKNGTGKACPIVKGDHVKASIGPNSALVIGNAT